MIIRRHPKILGPCDGYETDPVPGSNWLPPVRSISRPKTRPPGQSRDWLICELDKGVRSNGGFRCPEAIAKRPFYGHLPSAVLEWPLALRRLKVGSRNRIYLFSHLLLILLLPKIALSPAHAQIFPRMSHNLRPPEPNITDASIDLDSKQNPSVPSAKDSFSMNDATQGLLSKIFEMKDRVLISAHMPPVSLPPKNAVLLDSYLLKSPSVSTSTTTFKDDLVRTTTPQSSTPAAHEARLVIEDSLWEKTPNVTSSGKNSISFLPTSVSKNQGFSSSSTAVPPGAYQLIPTTENSITTTRYTRATRNGTARRQIVTGRPNFFYLGDNADSDDWWSSEQVAPGAEPFDSEGDPSLNQAASPGVNPYGTTGFPFPTTFSSRIKNPPAVEPTSKTAAFPQNESATLSPADTLGLTTLPSSRRVPEPFRLPTTTTLRQPAHSIPPFAVPMTESDSVANESTTATTARSSASADADQGRYFLYTTTSSTLDPFYDTHRDPSSASEKPNNSLANAEVPNPRVPGQDNQAPVNWPVRRQPAGNYDSRVQGNVLPAPYPVRENDRISPPFRRFPVDGASPGGPTRFGPGPGARPVGPDGTWRRPPGPVLPPPFMDTSGLDSPAPTVDDGIKLETCSLGDDSTCNQDGYEVCRKDDGVSTCVCRSGTIRRRMREPCQGSLNFYMYVRMNRLYDRELTYGPQFADNASYPYQTLSREVTLGIDSLLQSSDLQSYVIGSRVNSFAPFSDDILANVTITFAKQDLDPANFPKRLQDTMLDKLKLTERRLGNSRLFVGSLLNAVPGVQDINECLSSELNDCNISAVCSNTPGSYSCTCKPGYGDRYASDPLRSGRSCEACEETFCNQHGVCLMGPNGKICQCNGWYIGVQCQTDGQVVAVACGSSAIAVILIAITLLFLLRWSRSNSSQRGFHLTDPSSTLARSEISANTFTYVKGQNSEIGLDALSHMHGHSTLDNKIRLAYLVHPNLVTQMPAHQRNQLLDSNFYEVRPPLKNMAKGRILAGPAARASAAQRNSHISEPSRHGEHTQQSGTSYESDNRTSSNGNASHSEGPSEAETRRQPSAVRQCSF